MKRVLILEDTLEVVSHLIEGIAVLERQSGESIDVVVFGTSDAVEKIVNAQPADYYDAIILDRNCKRGGSFHVLDVQYFGPEKVVSISSMPHLNAQAAARGVERVVDKDHSNLEEFTEAVLFEVREILNV